jgi:hypothetical protein
MSFKSMAIVTTACLLFSGVLAAGAQESTKPLSNADVVKMVKSGLPESVIVSAIQSSPAKYDVSPDGLIALHKAGVTQGEMDAIMGATNKGTATPKPGPGSTAESAATAAPVSKSRMPKVFVVEGTLSKEIPLEKTQLAETKTKPSSMKNLAADSAVTQAMQIGVNTVAMDTAMHMNSPVAGSTMGQAGNVFTGLMGHRKPTVTYVWGVPAPASTHVLQTTSPKFSVDFSHYPGITPDDYAPTIVKLTPAQNTCRIVGATQGKEDVRSSPAVDWQIYSSFLEERVAVNAEKVKPGDYKVSPASPLLPGEYAVVLRPVSKEKKFSGGDVARAQGDGLMFDAAWTFQVGDNAE